KSSSARTDDEILARDSGNVERHDRRGQIIRRSTVYSWIHADSGGAYMDWWQDLLRYLVKEGATIKRAPLVFVSMLVLGAVGGWTGGAAWRGQEVANLNALAEGHKAEAARLRTEIDAFKSLQDRMQAIDDSFTDQQLKELERQLGIVAPGSEVELVEPRKESSAWDQIFTALRDSGWKVGTTNQLRSWAGPSTLAIVTTQAFAEPTVVLSTSNSSE